MNVKRILFTLILSIIFLPIMIHYLFVRDKNYIKSDLRRISDDSYNGYPTNLFFFMYIFIISKVFRNIYYYRIGNNKVIVYLFSLIYRKKSDLEINCKSIGFGLRIHHGHGTVIYADSIGENFTIWQGVTIGRGKKNNLGVDIPSIKSNVKIFTNSVVFGGIYIGEHVVIGAGNVIDYDIESYQKIKINNR